MSYSIRSSILTSSWWIYSLGKNATIFLTKPACVLNLDWTLWSGIVKYGKLFPLRVQRCGLAITTTVLLFSGILDAVRVLYVLGSTLSDMGDKFTICGSEGGIFCACGVFYSDGFCVEPFNLSEMGYKLPNGAEKSPIDDFDGTLEKE